MHKKILLIEDDKNLNYILKHFLEKNNFSVLSFIDGKLAYKQVSNLQFDIAVIDVNLDSINGLSILTKIKKNNSNLPVLIITAYGNVNDAVKAIKSGAYDYITKPFKEIELIQHINNALKTQELKLENTKLKQKLNFYVHNLELIGRSSKIKKLKTTLQQLQNADVNIFITGETGTGKELIAQLIHNNSSRHQHPFVAINCASIPENLIESELFGHIKGAFTGALKDRKGKFEEAHKGTIFLDEITEMPYHLQSKLLRSIQEKQIELLGSNKKIPIDVRFIAASNRNIEEAIKNKTFRQDLYYRLSVFPIHIPPLRERREDIPLLLEYFAKINNTEPLKFSTSALKKVLAYPWPGNVRELENFFHYLTVLSKKDKIDLQELPEKLLHSQEIKIFSQTKTKTMADYEKEILLSYLKKNNGNKSQTAKDLGITRSVLLYKLKKLNIKIP